MKNPILLVITFLLSSSHLIASKEVHVPHAEHLVVSAEFVVKSPQIEQRKIIDPKKAPPLTIGDLPSLLNGKYEYGGQRYSKPEHQVEHDIYGWIKEYHGGSCIDDSAPSPAAFHEVIDPYKNLPLLSFTDTAHSMPHNDGTLAYFTYMFDARFIRVANKQFYFSISRPSFPHEVFTHKPTPEEIDIKKDKYLKAHAKHILFVPF